MKLCDACHRHVRPSEGACPFCGRSLRTTGAGRLGAVILLGALEAACSGRPLEETGSDSATPSSSSSSSSTATGPTTSTTSGSTTTGTTEAATATSSTGELSSTSDLDSGDNGCAFYGGCPTDVADTTLCSTFAQDCPAGFKCVPHSSGIGGFFDSTSCFPVPLDPGKAGDACTVEGSKASGIDSCDVGLVCWNVDPETLAGECVPLCGGSPDAPTCAGDSACVFFQDVVSLCAPTCDPLAPACDAGEVCIANPEGPEFVCVVDVSEDGGATFEPCEFANDCDIGHACLDPALATECGALQPGCCLPFCDLDAPMCTGQGATCVPWFQQGEAPAGLEDVGVCALQ